MSDIWFGQTGAVTLSQHGDGDSRFPGWQENFGEGTFLGDTDFPNDDASHISVRDGYSATLREHGPSDSRYPGKEVTVKGGTSMNLSDFNDELSEMTISEQPSNQEEIDEVIDEDLGVDSDDLTSYDTNDDIVSAGISSESDDSNLAMYLGIGAVVLVLGYLIMKKN